MIGGAGNDTYLVDSSLDVVVEAAAAGTDSVNSTVNYVLSANTENLTLLGTSLSGTGNDLANVITGNTGANTLDGGAGNDTLDGGAGNDTLSGGAGDDTYVVDSTLDVVVEAAAAGTDTVSSSVNYVLGTNVENLNLVGTAATAVGNALANSITGNAANNTLDGGIGNDTLSGGDGSDSLSGGSGSDRLVGGTGLDLFVFNTALAADNIDSITDFVAGDRLELNRGIFSALSAGTTLTAAEFLSGAGLVAATTAQQRILHDSTTGALRYDSDGNGVAAAQIFANLNLGVVLSAADFALTGAIAPPPPPGPNVILGTVNADTLNGTAGNDSIDGQAGNDILNGAAGDDTLIGGLGNDSLNGGLGNDRLVGGDGLDRFVFNTALGATNLDTIADFVAGDLIELDRTVFAALSGGTTLTAAEFLSGAGVAAATTAQQRILLDTTSGALRYDSDGNGAAAAVTFASVNVGAPVNAAVFTLTGPVTPPPATNVINGTANADNLLGGAANETINGLAGNDTVNGGAGNDTINGGAGSDLLTGGLGTDSFLLADAAGPTNIDRISDFALGDRLLLSNTAFAGLSVGAVDLTRFITVRSDREAVASTTAATRLIFDRQTNNLFYDPDGTGAAGIQQILSITNGYRLLNTDVTVI